MDYTDDRPADERDEEVFEDEDELMTEAESEEEKDEAEEELERLVFGDNAGFKNELKGFRQDTYREDGEAVEGEEEALATLADADLFMVDTGDVPSQALLSQPEGELTAYQRDPPAWHDSDDDERQISLMAVPRLRKLRHFDGEDVISGRDYTARLRRQFEVIHPRPAWADWSQEINHKKRRRAELEEDEISDDASQNSDDEEDEDLSVQPLAKLLRSTAALTRSTQTTSTKRFKLRPEVIGIERMKDIQPTQPSAITSLTIHPTLPLLLSSGPSSTLYLHHLHPYPTPPDPANPLITSFHLKHTPLSTTAFSPPSLDAQQASPTIYLSGRRRYFHTWDLSTGLIRKITRLYGQQSTQRTFEVLKPSPCGRYIALLGSDRKGGGLVNILSATTSQWLCQARLESRKGLADFAWWGNGDGIVLVGRGGEVAEFSVQESKIVCRWQDEGAVGITTIALGGRIAGFDSNRSKKAAPPLLGPDRWIAIGSTSGIVNLYDRTSWIETGPASTNPAPTKTLENLTTPVSRLCFSPDGQAMCMASRWKRDALRLVHLPSCSVYRNWPTSKTPLGRVSAVALGEVLVGEGAEEKRMLVLVVGNEAGNLRGWEITG